MKNISNWVIKEKVCLVCKVIFHPNKHDTKTNFQFRQFCGKDCSYKYQRYKIQKGEVYE